MIRSPTFSPAAPTKTPPPSFVPLAVKRSTLGPRLPARRWLRNHACRRPSLNPSRLSLFHRRQVDGAAAPDGPASQRINQALTNADARLREADRQCHAIALEAQQEPKGNGHSRSVTIAMRGAGYEPVQANRWLHPVFLSTDRDGHPISTLV